MQDTLSRIVENLAGRVHGPMSFRFVLQPLVAIFFAIRDGKADARGGKPPYFWALFTQPSRRGEMLRHGWKSVGKVFIFALILDTAYQLWVLRWFYPGEALLVAFFLAIVPYVLLRGPANRLALAIRKQTATF